MHKKRHPHDPRHRRRPFLAALFEAVEPRRLFSAPLPGDTPAPGDEPPPQPAALPDLTAGAPRLFPSATRTALAAGDAATLSLSLSNIGPGDAASPFLGRVVLSRDTILSDDDLPLTTFQAANLPTGSEVPITANVTLPDSTSDDIWYPIAVIDPDRANPDLDPNNNTIVGAPLTLPAKRFMLVSATVPDSARAGQPFTITGTARVTGLHLDDPTFLSASLRRPGLSVHLQPDLAPVMLPIGTDGSTDYSLVVFTCTLTLPDSVPPGPFTLDLAPALFKGTGAVDAAYAAPTLDVATDAPYLSIATPTVSSSSITVDEPFTVTITARAAGGAATQRSTLSYYLSTTPELTDSTQLLGTSFLAPLAPGDTRTLRPSLTAPAPAGRYYLITTLTSPHGGAFVGTSTTTSTPIAINLSAAPTEPGPGPDPDPGPTPEPPPPDPSPGPVTPPPDLSLTNLTGPATVTAGSALWVSADPSVTGPLVRYYLSKDATLSDDAIDLGTLPASDDAALKLPADLAPGTYRLLAVIDPDDAIEEADESNNTALAPTPVTIVRPDLKGTLAAKTKSIPASTQTTLIVTLTNTTAKFLKRNHSVSYYLSSDPTFSPDDTRIAKRPLTVSLAKKQTGKFNVTFKLPATAPLGPQYVLAVLDTPNVAKAHLELASPRITVTAPKLTAEVRTLKRQGPSTYVTLRLTNTGTAPQTAPITLQLSTPTQRNPLLTAKRPLTLAPKKSLLITLPLPPKAPKDLTPAALSATVL